MSKPGVAGGDGAAVAPDPECPGAPCYPISGCSETTPANFSVKEAKLSGPVVCGENQSVNGALVTAIDLPVKEGSHAEDTGVEQQRAGGGNGLPGIAQGSHADESEPTTSYSHAEYTGEEQQSADGDNGLPGITQGSHTDDPEPTTSGCGEEPLLATYSSCLNDSITGIEGMKHVASNDINDVSRSPKARKLTRSSCYHGVSKNKWTGRFEAHLWDGSFQNVGTKRKGKLVYLGGYDSEETAGRAHDLAAIKYWGSNASTKLNFSVSEYWRDIEGMEIISREEYVASLIRRSSCFSRGASIYRGVTKKKDGRWQARIGRIADRKDIYLGTYNTEEEAAQAYDIAAVKLKGFNAVTNFDISNYSEDLECLE